MKRKSVFIILLFALLAGVIGLGLSQGPEGDHGVKYGLLSLNEIIEIGQNQYEVYCQFCHGAGGKGDGPFSNTLDPKPSDLTQLAKNNGGSFPWNEMLRVIDGRSQVAVHGTRQMPVWGERFRAEKFTEDEPYGSDRAATARIECVAYYLSTIQEK